MKIYTETILVGMRDNQKSIDLMDGSQMKIPGKIERTFKFEGVLEGDLSEQDYKLMNEMMRNGGYVEIYLSTDK